MRFGKKFMIAAMMMAMIVTGSSMQTKAAGKFDPAFYAAKYPDVWAAFGADQQALYNHYVTIGQREGRIPYNGAINGEIVEGMAGTTTTTNTAKFNAVFYATKYPDVAAAIGTNAEALFNHYITCGQREMRIPYPDAAPGEAVGGIANAQEMAQQTARKPVTHVVKYIAGCNDWRYLSGTNTWQNNTNGRELYYLQQSIMDGDVIVVDGAANTPGLNLTVPVSLSNVTFKGSGGGIITAVSVENAYILGNCTGIINGNVTNGYVYDNGVANFNSNVTNLYIARDRTNQQTVSVLGTVDLMQNLDGQRVTRQLFSFRRGTFYMENGSLKTTEANYSPYLPRW